MLKTITRVSSAFIAILVLIASAITLGIALRSKSATASGQIAYTNIDMNDPWTTVRGTSSGGYTAAAHSLTQAVDSTVDPGDPSAQTEALSKSVPDSASIAAKLTIDSDWQTKPVRVGLWGEIFSSQDSTVGPGWPILEFTTIGDGGFTGFRAYDTRGGASPVWHNLEDVAFSWGQTYTLKITYNQETESYDFYVNDTNALSLPASRSDNDNSPRDTFRNILFVVYNSVTENSADNYTAQWTDAAYGIAVEAENTAQLTSPSGKQIALTTPAGTTITASQAVEADTQHPDGTNQYPLGLVSFSFTTTTADNQVVLVFETDLKPDQLTARKYNPTTKQYKDVPGATITQTNHNGKAAVQLSYNLQDNGELDLDPAAGSVSDPVGLTLTASAAADLANTGQPRSTLACIAIALIAGASLLIAVKLRRQAAAKK